MNNYPKHLSFPFRIAADGRTATVASLPEHVRDEIMQLILTNQGERLFVPEFGGGVRRLVFEGASEATAGLSKAVIAQAISRWLGERITLENLDVTLDNTTISIDIGYRLTSTGETRVVRFQRNGSI